MLIALLFLLLAPAAAVAFVLPHAPHRLHRHRLPAAADDALVAELRASGVHSARAASFVRRARRDPIAPAAVRRIASYLSETYGAEAACGMLAACPKLLTRDVATQLVPAGAWLASLYVASAVLLLLRPLPNSPPPRRPRYGAEKALENAVRRPDALCAAAAPDLLASPAAGALRAAGVGEPALRRLARGPKGGGLLTLSAAALEPALACLADLLGSEAAAARAVEKWPSLAGLSASANLAPTAAHLRAELRLPDDKFQRLLRRSPQLLGLSVAGNIDPTLTWLRRTLGVADVGRIASRHAGVLLLSVESNLDPTLAFFKSLGLSAAAVAGMVNAYPGLLALSVEKNVAPTVAFLARGDVLGARAVDEMRVYPQVLSCSLTANLEPKCALLRTLGYDLPKDLRARHLGASASKRLLPRARYLAGEGLFLPTLGTLAVATDAAFVQACGLDGARFAAALPGLRDAAGRQESWRLWLDHGLAMVKPAKGEGEGAGGEVECRTTGDPGCG